MKLVNLSHPMNNEAEAIAEVYWHIDEIVRIPVQIDMNGDLLEQAEALVQQVKAESPDYIIPPGLAWLACYIALKVTAKIVIVQKVGMQFVPVESF